VGLTCARDDVSLLVAGERGYGKRSGVELFRKTARGAKGVIALKVTEKTGPLVGCAKVVDGDELLIITEGGMIIRTEANQLREMGRATQGVRLINLKDGDKVVAIEVINSESGETLL
jgi:DNA gyrase subunit A